MVATSSSSICRTNTVAAPGWSVGEIHDQRPTSGSVGRAPFQADEDIKLNASLGPLRLGFFFGGEDGDTTDLEKNGDIYTTSLIDYGIKEGSHFKKKRW